MYAPPPSPSYPFRLSFQSASLLPLVIVSFAALALLFPLRSSLSSCFRVSRAIYSCAERNKLGEKREYFETHANRTFQRSLRICIPRKDSRDAIIARANKFYEPRTLRFLRLIKISLRVCRAHCDHDCMGDPPEILPTGLSLPLSPLSLS